MAVINPNTPSLAKLVSFLGSFIELARERSPVLTTLVLLDQYQLKTSLAHFSWCGLS